MTPQCWDELNQVSKSLGRTVETVFSGGLRLLFLFLSPTSIWDLGVRHVFGLAKSSSLPMWCGMVRSFVLNGERS